MKYLIDLKDENDTLTLGEYIGKSLTSGVFFALNGDLGAGKTVFVRGLARGLNISGPITSPTFTVMCEYAGRMPLYHFDLYRLSGEDFFEFEDFLFDSSAVVAVEWSERMTEFPENTVTVNINKTENGTRIAEICDKRNLLSFLGDYK